MRGVRLEMSVMDLVEKLVEKVEAAVNVANDIGAPAPGASGPLSRLGAKLNMLPLKPDIPRCLARFVPEINNDPEAKPLLNAWKKAPIRS